MHPEVWFQLFAFRLQAVASVWDMPGFWFGFIAGLAIAFVVGFMAQRILLFLGPVLAFFKPSKIPVANPGPSPADAFFGCLLKIVFVGIAVFVLFIFVVALM